MTHRYRCHHLQGGRGSLRIIDCMDRQGAGCPARELGPCRWDWRRAGVELTEEDRELVERLAERRRADEAARREDEALALAIGLGDAGLEEE